MEQQILQQEVQPGASAPQVEAQQQVPDVSPADRARRHYCDVIGALLDDAIKDKTPRIFVDVATFNLAWLIVECGPDATGNVLERLGSHITYFSDRQRAAREAEEAREEGKRPH